MSKNISLKEISERTQNLKVLYVEDSPEARGAILAYLENFFKKIVTAEDGRDGLAKYTAQEFDLIITDLSMPKLDGIDMIAKIREDNTKIPILVLTAVNESKHFLESIRYGVDGYLMKPFESQQFAMSLKKIIQKLDDAQKILDYQNHLEKLVQEKTKEIEHRCLHEYYTDLPNAVMLLDDLMTHEYNFMLLLDISHFSVLNKEYGKEFANHVIIKTARILEKHIHRNAKLYKTESDRFTILCKDVTLKEIYLYCDQIVSFFDMKNIQVDGSELHVTFNIGVDKIRADVSETLINCEYALDKSKELGSRHYEIFKDNASSFQDEKEAIKWLRVSRELVLNDAIVPYFQPIQNTQTGKVYKYEALARGILDGEVIAPIYFIRSAEKLGLVTAITRIMVNKSFAFFEGREEEFSINLTERDLLEGYLIKFLTEKIVQFHIDPRRVTFEILENITIAKNSKKITKKLNKLKEMGFKVAVDDFGIENSNFSRLLEIRLDYIKIDGIFIKDLKKNERNRTITRAIVNLAKTLGIKTVAEYVEDDEINEIIRECGIDYAQGFHIGKPESKLLV